MSKQLLKFRLIAAVLALFGLAAVVLGLLQVIEGLRNSAWPVVEGRVLQYERSSFGTSAGRDVPKITYEYLVNGRSYQGHAVSAAGTRPHITKGHVRLSPGDVVSVSHDPAAPDRSVLLPGVHSTSYFVLTLGAAFLVSAALLTRGSFKPKGF